MTSVSNTIINNLYLEQYEQIFLQVFIYVITTNASLKLFLQFKFTIK